MQFDPGTYRVDQLIDAGVLDVGDGYRAKNSELSAEGLPFARAGNINDGFWFAEADRFPTSELTRVGSKVSRPGDVVFTSKGTVGRFAFVTERVERFVYSPQLCFWRALNTLVLDPRFLFYWMQGPEFMGQVGYLKGQTDMADYVSLCDQRRMSMTLVPLSVQQEVAATLGALDDRINLLRQTNTTLESIAQALFKSWFVDFDPVHAKQAGREPEGMDAATAALFPAEFQESALGLIPKGWRMGTVRDVCSIYDSRRIPLSGKDRATRKGPYPYYGAAALMDYVDDFLFDGVYVLLGEDGSVTNADGTPVMQYVWGKFWVNNHAHVLQGANGVCTEHLMLALRGVDFTPYVTGAVQAKLNQANLFRIPFLIPNPEVSAGFESEVAPLYEKLRNNVAMIQTLSGIRDTVLPRLISGKLRLPEAQEQLEGALA